MSVRATRHIPARARDILAVCGAPDLSVRVFVNRLTLSRVASDSFRSETDGRDDETKDSSRLTRGGV